MPTRYPYLPSKLEKPDEPDVTTKRHGMCLR